MRVLLCQSYLGVRSGEPLVFPLGLSYLASAVKEGNELQCWDPNVSDNPMGELPNVLSRSNPDVVGVSLRNIDSVFSFNKRSYYLPFVSMIRLIRKYAPSCKIVVGGTGFSIFAEEIMKRNPEIDVGLVREGEQSFAELLKNIDAPLHVRGLFARKDGELFFSGEREQVSFDDLPVPSRSFFDLKKYANAAYSIGVQSKRGCIFGCIFCPSKLIWGCAVRLRSPRKVVDEIENLANDYGINSFSFAESVFNFPADYSRKLCAEIIRRKLAINWGAAFNPAFVNLSFMELAAKAGCDLFSFSPDGASNNSMRLLGKNFDVNSVENSIKIARKIEGIKVGYSFLYDLPFCNGEHVLGLIRLIAKMIGLGPMLGYLSFSKIRIYPNTPMFETALKQGKIAKTTDLLYPTFYESDSSINPSNLLPKTLRGSLIVINKAHEKVVGGSTFKFCS